MGKRKRLNGPAKIPGIEEFNPKASNLTFNSYEDIPDSEDEFHINRDKVLLDTGPEAKRRKQSQQEDDFLEPSDEEVLVYSDSASEDGAEDDYKENMEPESGGEEDADDEESGDDGSGDEINGWGDKRADYYNADAIETEQDALDEEVEARRIQQKRLKALKEADFGFDEREWQDSGKIEGGVDGDGGVYTEVLPQLQISDDMNSAQRLKLLNTRYPEFEPLVTEFLDLQPLHEELSVAAKGRQGTPVETMKCQALSAYLGSLAMYFAIFTSTANADCATSFPLPPHELRNHPVMETLVRCRDTWAKVKDMETPSSSIDTFAGIPSDPDVADVAEIPDSESSANEADPIAPQADPALHPDTAASLARRAARLRQTEESLASISAATTAASLRQPHRPTITDNKKTASPELNDLDSDVGDEPALAPHEAAEKARRKKSLRFYTSQIAQKANKRANAGRAAGGDDDLPYRERLRDRQERLVREAEKRGRKENGELGEGLGVQEQEDVGVTNKEREMEEGGGVGDEYSKMLEGKVRAKRDGKHRREEAYVRAREEGGVVVRQEAKKVGLDGRREIGFAIEKNKGMTPRRKKENRNPRVKKKKQYEDKQKKLRSMKPMYKGGEGRGGYGGELTGIKKGLVRSVKL